MRLNLKRSLAIILILLIITQFYTYFYYSAHENLIKNNECNQEWEILLAKNCYFRKNIAYYYTDIKMIRLGAQRHVNFNFKYQLLVQVIQNKNVIDSYNLTNIKTSITSSPIESFIFEYIDADFDIKNYEKIKVKVSILFDNNEQTVSTQNSIDLMIKKFNQDDNLKQHSMLCCSSFNYYSKNFIKNLDYWIRMNKLSGYKKIVLFNHSIESNDLFTKYNKFVDIIQYQCIPNLLLLNNNKNYITINDIKTYKNNQFLEIIKYTMHFQRIIINECVLMNKDKYSYIAIFDTDELILARNPNFLIPKKFNLKFQMTDYLKMCTMNKIFNEIEKMFTLNLQKYSINQNDVFTYDKEFKNERKTYNLYDSYIFIESKQDYEYAKQLYAMHKTYVEPFLRLNYFKLMNKVPNVFNRFYYFNNAYISKDGKSMWKTVHYSLKTELVRVHVPVSGINETILVSNKHGHLSHFRNDYKRSFRNASIQEIIFDFDYFNNYVKKILI